MSLFSADKAHDTEDLLQEREFKARLHILAVIFYILKMLDTYF
jgi:hypothetical protein